MNDDGFSVVTAFMAATATINAVSAVSKKHDPTPLLFASAGLYVLLLVIGLFTRWEWVKPFAGIIFLIAVLSNAFPLIASIISLVQGLQLQSAKNTQAKSQAQPAK
jgi:polyferredoxin